MPNETQIAVAWALHQEGVNMDDGGTLVDKVRDYFNANSIEYDTFSFTDLEPFL